MTCAWCPDFVPPTVPGISHGMCQACSDRMMLVEAAPTDFLLVVTYRSGRVSTITFPTLNARALFMIGLASQPVTCQIPEAA